MTEVPVAQIILNGLMSGAIYVLVALGLTLVLSIMGIVNLAHGELYVFGAYGAYYFCVVAGLNFLLALFISTLLVGLLGIGIEKIFFRPFRQGNFLPAVIMATGLMLILQTTTVVTFGGSTKVIVTPFPGVITVAGTTISRERLVIILVAIVLVATLLFLMRRTKIGQAMVAVSQDLDAAALQGISVDQVSSVAMFLGCALAAAAGALMGAVFGLSPAMGGFALMKGIAVIILGGLGSIPGAVIGGLILGLIDGIVPALLSTQMASLVGFVAIILILVFRPQGIMGRE
ncbi:MAG: branched-chain amino acid ABC transporter permease [Dehalococcoidia bacterium]